jgi:hypothetical protein
MRISWKPLDRKVLVVAKEGSIGDWACYIGAVDGQSHESEYTNVLQFGSKLPQSIAEILFPSFKHLNYRQ